MVEPERILVVRLGAMGDIIHTLPAVASLRQSFPRAEIAWVVARKWAELLEGNPNIDKVIYFERGSGSALMRSWRKIRAVRPDVAIDFQGLLQSALVARASRPRVLFGLAKQFAREPAAALFYSRSVRPAPAHIVERNMELAKAAGACNTTGEAWIPQGRIEGELPAGPYILTSPFAGWKSKQWPLERYQELGALLLRDGLELVANVPAQRAGEVSALSNVRVHTSSLSGLIAATRGALGIVGLDSGPLHLGAALKKPGVALFGPTDPQRNGPYGESMTVLRSSGAVTTYKRNDAIDSSMLALEVTQVHGALLRALDRAKLSR